MIRTTRAYSCGGGCAGMVIATRAREASSLHAVVVSC